MSARLLAALRRDPLVVSAVGGAPGKALLVWNGDWMRSRGEDGKGLAAVRESMMWEVGFAPPECRAQPVHGLILFALGGGVKVVVGAGRWRRSGTLKSGGGAGERWARGRSLDRALRAARSSNRVSSASAQEWSS